MPTRSSRLTPQVGRGMHHKHQVIEEPCEAKVSRTVLEPRQGGDSLSLGSSSTSDTSKRQPSGSMKQLGQMKRQKSKPAESGLETQTSA